MILLTKKLCQNEIELKLVESSFHPGKNEKLIIARQWNKLIKDAERKKQLLWDEPNVRFEDFVIKENGNMLLIVSTIPFSTRYALRFLPKLIDRDPSIEPKGMMVNCFVSTSDNYFIFGEKSKKYNTHLSYTFVGGVYSSSDKTIPSPIEIAKQEIHEELGVKNITTKDSCMIGIYENDYKNIGCVTYTKLNLNKKEVLQVFNNLDKKNQELSKLNFIRPSKLSSYISKNLPQNKEAYEIFQNCSQ